MSNYTAATQPTMYFIGVTTKESSIMNVFPLWAKELGLENAVIKGIDLPIHGDTKVYREAVAFIKEDPFSLGALVTTHKLDLFNACKDMFDYIDPYAEKLGEVSSLSKRDGKFCAHAKDPISSGLSLEHFVPDNFWKNHDGDVLLMGAGGSSLAMSMYLTKEEFGDNVPAHIILANRSQPRLTHAAEVLAGLNAKTKFSFICKPTPQGNDELVAGLKPYSLVVNATGLGKDAPGSPTTNAVCYPPHTLVWEINYRGELLFKQQAEAQAQEKSLHVEDGWVYFLYGWTQVISEVFHVPIDDIVLEKLSKIAKQAGGGK